MCINSARKSTYLLIILILLSSYSFAKSGCTDPDASNYDSSATVNDGSCTYPYKHINPTFIADFPDKIIDESSGVQLIDGKLWTHNDGGNSPEIYSVNTKTGAILQTVIVDNAKNIDWEDITADSKYIYLEDAGNNHGTRTDLRILKIRKADIGNGAVKHVKATLIKFSYADQKSFTDNKKNNFDCESLISIKDHLYIFTKDRGDLQTRVYKLPKTEGSYVVNPIDSFNSNGMITGSDYNPAINELVLIGYKPGHSSSFLWLFSDFKGISFFSGNKRRVEINNGGEWQTEGVCYESNMRIIISCEKRNATPSSFYYMDIMQSAKKKIISQAKGKDKLSKISKQRHLFRCINISVNHVCDIIRHNLMDCSCRVS
jgi:hypothetical protein